MQRTFPWENDALVKLSGRIWTCCPKLLSRKTKMLVLLKIQTGTLVAHPLDIWRQRRTSRPVVQEDIGSPGI